MSLSNSQPPQKLHVVLFPFMSKGHTIPLLHLSHLLLHRNIAVTVFTTAANRPFVAEFLFGTTAAVITIPFPTKIAGIPAGVESTDSLPSISLFPYFATATELMKPHFDKAMESLSPRVSFIVSDGFLWWTQDSASKLNIPRIVTYGMSTYAMAVVRDMVDSGALAGVSDPNVSVTVPSFPWIKVTLNDFDRVFVDPSHDTVHSEFVVKSVDSAARSFGVIFNSFREIESPFLDYWIEKSVNKAWCIGPLSVAGQNNNEKTEPQRPYYLQWLDERLERGRSVLYVAFGSQVEICSEQMLEIARGLEESEVDFMWVVRENNSECLDSELEERVKERGIVVRHWVDQIQILKHESVKGFLSHCGWNSVSESVFAAAVPVLAWPMMADQPINARMVAEELKVGMKVSEEFRRVVKWEELKKSVKEFMEGDACNEFRENAKRVAGTAKKAVAEGGSSWLALEALIQETCMEQNI